MKIKRTRYVVMRNNRTEIWCGLTKNNYFKKVDEIGRNAIRSYDSEKRAKSSYNVSCCPYWNENYEIVEITETLDLGEVE